MVENNLFFYLTSIATIDYYILTREFILKISRGFGIGLKTR